MLQLKVTVIVTEKYPVTVIVIVTEKQ